MNRIDWTDEAVRWHRDVSAKIDQCPRGVMTSPAHNPLMLFGLGSDLPGVEKQLAANGIAQLGSAHGSGCYVMFIDSTDEKLAKRIVLGPGS